MNVSRERLNAANDLLIRLATKIPNKTAADWADLSYIRRVLEDVADEACPIPPADVTETPWREYNRIAEGDVDHDDEDRRAYREELNERPRPSEY